MTDKELEELLGDVAVMVRAYFGEQLRPIAEQLAGLERWLAALEKRNAI